MRIQEFNHTIDFWIDELKKYTLSQLHAKPAPGSWSLGQLYMHLLADTQYYLEQIHACLASGNNIDGDSTPHAKVMLRNNEFPDILIEGSPDNIHVPQPASMEQVMTDLLALKAEMNRTAAWITTTPVQGKSQHPGFNYLTAEEWLQFADMHWRHHLRQKKRIDTFLNTVRL